ATQNLLRLETAAGQKPQQTAAGKKLKVLGMLQFAHRINEHAENAGKPEYRIRRRQHEQPTRVQHPRHLVDKPLLRGHLFDDFGAEDDVESRLGIVEADLDIAGAPIKSALAVFLDPGRRNVDAMQPVSFGGECSRICARPATNVEDVEALSVRDALDGIKLA